MKDAYGRELKPGDYVLMPFRITDVTPGYHTLTAVSAFDRLQYQEVVTLRPERCILSEQRFFVVNTPPVNIGPAETVDAA